MEIGSCALMNILSKISLPLQMKMKCICESLVGVIKKKKIHKCFLDRHKLKKKKKKKKKKKVYTRKSYL